MAATTGSPDTYLVDHDQRVAAEASQLVVEAAGVVGVGESADQFIG